MADPSDALQRILESGRSIRLGRGLVSKTAYVAALVVVIWGLAIWRLDDNMVLNALMLGAALAETIFAVWFILGTQRFAAQIPAQAMLEGAELLEWQKMDLQARGMPPIEAGPTTIGYLAKPEGEN